MPKRKIEELKFFFLFLLLFLAGVSRANAGEEMSAEKAIEIGLKYNFDIQIARNNARIARNNVGLGTAGFLPVLDISGNYQYSNTDQETNSPFSFGKSETWGFDSHIQLNWRLFDGFKMFIDRDRFAKLANLGEAEARRLIENTAVSILRAFFDLVQQEQLLDVAKSTVEISETRLNKERVRRDVGGSSSTDLLNAQVSYNNDRASLINQELEVAIALRELNLLLGKKPETPVAVEKQIRIPPLTLSLEELAELALKRNSSLVVAQQNRKISQDEVKIARSNFSPRLNFNGRYGYSDRTISSSSPRFTEDITTQSKDAFVGLNLSWNLFNGFRNKIELENTKIRLKNQQLALRDTENQISGLIQEEYATFQKGLELIELEEQNVLAARQNLELQQDRYQIGSTSSLEFRDAQLNLARAQISLIVARYQSRITRLRIDQLVGNLMIQ